VGTSGGGFCLMTEGLSLAGNAELPIVIMMGQRTGPSTGLPTYTAQSDLHFVLNAGQGEFPRLIVAPGDAEDAYYWSGIALNMAWKYQVPAFILSDKTVSEALYSFDSTAAGEPEEESPAIWDVQGTYNRYKYTGNGVSPLAFPPDKRAIIKVDSYTHDEYGITTEDGKITASMSDKRMLKGKSLASEMEKYETVKTFGQGKTALVCWGSNKGVCTEAGEKHGLKVVQVLMLSPFPSEKLKIALNDVDRTIAVECNSTGQLGTLARYNGIKFDQEILKYNGRPFSLDDLEAELGKVLK
jgi:2-oxoglutarate/2-oxoacid ferredoxin oxidoreductase subunit alpha